MTQTRKLDGTTWVAKQVNLSAKYGGKGGKGAVPSSERQAKMARIEREAVLHEVQQTFVCVHICMICFSCVCICMFFFYMWAYCACVSRDRAIVFKYGYKKNVPVCVRMCVWVGGWVS